MENQTVISTDDDIGIIDENETGVINAPTEDSDDSSNPSNPDSLLVNDTRELIPHSSECQQTSGITQSDEVPSNINSESDGKL